MNKEIIKQKIALYIEGELNPAEKKEVEAALAQDKDLQKYAQELKQSWQMLDEWKEIEPRPDYVSRFWTTLSTRQTPGESFKRYLQSFLRPQRIVPACISVLVLLLVSVFVLKNYSQTQSVERQLSTLSVDEIEMIEDMEVAKDLDILEDLDVLEDMEVIKNLKILDKSA